MTDGLSERVAVLSSLHDTHLRECEKRWSRLTMYLIAALGVLCSIIGGSLTLAVSQMNNISDSMADIREQQAVATAERKETARSITDLKVDVKDVLKELRMAK